MISTLSTMVDLDNDRIKKISDLEIELKRKDLDHKFQMDNLRILIQKILIKISIEFPESDSIPNGIYINKNDIILVPLGIAKSGVYGVIITHNKTSNGPCNFKVRVYYFDRKINDLKVGFNGTDSGILNDVYEIIAEIKNIKVMLTFALSVNPDYFTPNSSTDDNPPPKRQKK